MYIYSAYSSLRCLEKIAGAIATVLSFPSKDMRLAAYDREACSYIMHICVYPEELCPPQFLANLTSKKESGRLDISKTDSNLGIERKENLAAGWKPVWPSSKHL
jgi:hypothetical protein